MSADEKTITQDFAPLERIGRYRVLDRLGSGMLGVVYKAWDEDLRRDVAIKTPHGRWLVSTRHVESWLAQSRQIAELDHQGFVPLYDSGTTAEGQCYVVMKFMTHGSLASRLGHERSSAVRSVRVIVDVARALHEAHRRGLLHRNVKPSNILLDDGDRPCLADFGMPLAENLFDDAPEDAVAWLSPEQLRGEMHRIDARTDVYSLALVLYSLLAGRSPFLGQTAEERVAQAMLVDPPALAELVSGLPIELARVCHKALSRRVADRYSTALDFAEDLEACLALLSASGEKLPAPRTSAQPTSLSTPVSNSVSATVGDPSHSTPTAASSISAVVRVVPKGLRSFDREDADFFLDLLPGPRGRDGLPEILRLWKARLEETDPDSTFPVGLIYGPSGCGKSSLVKAGLLPRLDERIVRVYLEATPEGTETRLLSALRRRCPRVAPDLPLTETLAQIRQGRRIPTDAKVVIFVDQFEQWLHSNRDVERPELAQALRQCDGRRLQCVIMVRDDFWMAVTRFMQELEVKLIEGRNSAAVDLFSPQHARKVLIAFGRAYACLPEVESRFGAAEQEFLREAIAGLTTDGKVVSVQLSLFADMIKQKPWVPATLKEVGGTAGIGVAFLEETFSGLHAPPEHRRHQRAARGVLKQLLPDQGTNIKGRMHSREQLLAKSGYAAQPAEFDELLQLLDQSLRLVTPADPEGADTNSELGFGISDMPSHGRGISEGQAASASSEIRNPKSQIPNTFYQLTHDFLVLSIRRWLVRKQQETRRGRAELLLAEKADNWTSRPENRFLPACWQWVRIRALTSRADWNAGERRMMRSAGRYHAVRGLALALVFALAGWGGYEGIEYVRAYTLRDRLLFVSTAQTSDVISEIASHERWVRPLLEQVVTTHPADSREVLHARLGLLPGDSAQAEPLLERALAVDDATLRVLIRALAGHRDQLIDRLWKLLGDEQSPAEHRLRAALLLADYAPPANAENQARWQPHLALIARRLHAATLADPARYTALVEALAPVSDMLIDPLRRLANDPANGESERSIASNILLEFASSRADVLVEILHDGGSPVRQSSVIDKLALLKDQALLLLEPDLASSSADLTAGWKDPPLGPGTSAVSAECAGQIAAGAGLIAERFAFCQTLPFSEFREAAQSLQQAGYRPTRVRPFRDGQVLRVAAAWTRDGRDGRYETDLTEGALRRQLDGETMQSDLLIDLATYEHSAGERHVAVWSPRREGDPEAKAYLGKAGGEGAPWPAFRDERAKAGFAPVALDFFPLPAAGRYIAAAVFWKGAGTAARELRPAMLYERELAGDLAGQLQVTVDVAPVPALTTADSMHAYRLADIEDRNRIIAADPNRLDAWYDRGFSHFLLGHDEEAIRDFSHFIDNGGEKSAESWRFNISHTHRSLAAARLGQKQTAESFLQQTNRVLSNDAYGDRFWRAMADATHDPDHAVPPAFEKFLEPHIVKGHALRDAARVYGWAAGPLFLTDPKLARQYLDRVVDFLTRSIQAGEYAVWVLNDGCLSNAITDDPRIRRLQVDVELGYRLPIRLARQGAGPQARAELAQFLQTAADVHEKMRVEAATLAYLGEDELAARKLEAAIADKPDDKDLRFWGAALAYSLLVYAVEEQRPDRARAYADRAIELTFERLPLQAESYQVAFRRELNCTTWQAQPLRNMPRFQEVLAALDRQYSLITRSDADLESQELHGLDPQQHLDRSRQLAAQGWRLVAIDACDLSGSAVPSTASVWHRPRVTERQSDQFASRQAATAVALTRLGRDEKVWPLLKDSPDPRLRTAIEQLLTPAGTEPHKLAGRLASELDPAIRRTLVLALGESGIDSLPKSDRDRLSDQLIALFQKDPDPGVHSSAEWTLRKWGQIEQLKAAKRELAAVSQDARRAWIVTPQGHTLVRVAGPVDAALGSPASEPDREQFEQAHRRRIPRSYEMATQEVTVEQFQEFLNARPEIKHSLNKSAGPQPDCPVNNVTWYHVAQYCRWLSEREGLPEEEMVYPPIADIKPGMALKPYSLARSGYRIPTEAEWEYACRAGTATARYYGQSADRAGQFGWFKDNSAGRSWPTGLLRPNDLGLFDLYGNINEICAEHLVYPRASEREIRDDASPTQKLPLQMSFRGGSFLHEPRWLRSAGRYPFGDYLGMAQAHIGFRLVRTVPDAEATAARGFRRQADDLLRKGEAAEAAPHYAQATAAYERLLGLHPDNQDTAWEFSDFLLEVAANGALPEEEIEHWREHLALCSLNGWARLACARAALNQSEAGLEALAKCGKNPTGSEVRDYFLLSQAHRLLAQSEEARYWLDRGLAKFDEKSADRALKVLVADAMVVLTDAAPDDFALLIRRVRLLQQADEAAAEQLFERLFEASGSDPDILIARGRLYAEAGDAERADADFTRAAKLSRDELDRFLHGDWWAIGPYPADFEAMQPPEKEPDPSRSPAVAAGSKPLSWQRVPVQTLGRINLRTPFNSDNISVYLLTYVYSPVERTAAFVMGGDDQVRVWLNGTEVYELLLYNMDPFKLPRVPVVLRAGRNTLLVKVQNGIADFGLQMRMTDNPFDQGWQLAALGLWEEAAPRLRRASAVFTPGTLSVANEIMLARVFLAAGDSEGYHEVCRRVFQSYAGNNTPVAAENMAFLAGLGDGAGLTRERLIELADLAGKVPAREFWQPFYDALAHYRAGNFERVLQILDADSRLAILEKAQSLRALACFRLGRTDEARRDLQAVTERYTTYTSQVLAAREFRLAPLLWWEFAESQILYREARQLVEGLSPQDDSTTRALTARAREFWKQRDPATQDFDDAVYANPTSAATWRARAGRFQQLNEPAKAAANYLKAVSLDPGNVATRREFEQILSALGDPGEALTHLVEASGLRPDQPQYWLERGRLWRSLEKPDLAVADFAKALELFPPATNWETSNWGAPRSRAAYEMAEDNEMFDRLLAMRPDDLHLRTVCARRHFLFSRWKQALALYAPVIRQLPLGDESAEYAALLWLTGDQAGYRDFLEWMAERLNAGSGWHEGFHFARASFPSEESVVEPKRLVAALELAVKAESFPWYLHVSGLALLRDGRIAAAIDRFQESRRNNQWGSKATAQNELGLALASAQQNDFTAAAHWFDEAVAHIGTEPDGTWPTDWIYLAVLRRLAHSKIVGHEIEQITSELIQGPQDLASLLARRAKLNVSLHHWQEAANDYQRLLALDEKDDALWRQLAFMFVQQEKWAQAAQALRQSIALKPDLEQRLHSMELATLLARAGDVEGHGRWTREILSAVSDTTDPFVAERVAKGMLLLPPLSENLEAVVRLADRALTLDPASPLIPRIENTRAETTRAQTTRALATRALAAYRQGDNAGALDWAEKSLEADRADPTWYRAAQAQLVIAMVRHKLNEPEAARVALSRAAALIQPTTDRYEAADEMNGQWHDWMIPQLLLDEAQALLGASR